MPISPDAGFYLSDQSIAQLFIKPGRLESEGIELYPPGPLSSALLLHVGEEPLPQPLAPAALRHPEDIHHIFKRFYRSRFSQDTQGAGLGLPLALAITEAHRGTLSVESSPGQGALFTMTFLKMTKL